MRDLSFLKQNHHDRKIDNPKSGNRKDRTPKTNPAIQQLFKNGNGKKIISLAHQNKDYPNKLPNSCSICLDYQIRGQCNRGANYRNKASYSFFSKA